MEARGHLVVKLPQRIAQPAPARFIETEELRETAAGRKLHVRLPVEPIAHVPQVGAMGTIHRVGVGSQIEHGTVRTCRVWPCFQQSGAGSHLNQIQHVPSIAPIQQKAPHCSDAFRLASRREQEVAVVTDARTQERYGIGSLAPAEEGRQADQFAVLANREGPYFSAAIEVTGPGNQPLRRLKGTCAWAPAAKIRPFGNQCFQARKRIDHFHEEKP